MAVESFLEGAFTKSDVLFLRVIFDIAGNCCFINDVFNQTVLFQRTLVFHNTVAPSVVIFVCVFRQNFFVVFVDY